VSEFDLDPGSTLNQFSGLEVKRQGHNFAPKIPKLTVAVRYARQRNPAPMKTNECVPKDQLPFFYSDNFISQLRSSTATNVLTICGMLYQKLF